MALARVNSVMEAINENRRQWEQTFVRLEVNLAPNGPALAALRDRRDGEVQIAAAMRTAMLQATATIQTTPVEGLTDAFQAIQGEMNSLREQYRTWRATSDASLRVYFNLDGLVGADRTFQILMEN